MALINCPECGREVSDKSKVCIHCGYPLEELMKEKKETRDRSREWEQRFDEVETKTDEEAIPEFIALGDEGYVMGYIFAGIRYSNNDEYSKAMEYYQKAYALDPKYEGGLPARKIGFLYKLRGSFLFNPTLAIQYLTEADDSYSNQYLGQIFNPSYKNDGFEQYKDANKSLNHYSRALEKGRKLSCIYNDIGCLYGDSFDSPVVAACYCLIAKRTMDDSRTQTCIKNYDVFIQRVRNECGADWEKDILSIHSVDEIDPMIHRVNAEIRARKEAEIHCPNCRSANVQKISTASRVASTYMWGPFSSKWGKQFKCNNCGYMW